MFFECYLKFAGLAIEEERRHRPVRRAEQHGQAGLDPRLQGVEQLRVRSGGAAPGQDDQLPAGELSGAAAEVGHVTAPVTLREDVHPFQVVPTFLRLAGPGVLDPEPSGLVAHELVELLEGVLVEEQVEALANSYREM